MEQEVEKAPENEQETKNENEPEAETDKDGKDMKKTVKFRSAWNFFMAEFRQKIQEENPGIGLREISKRGSEIYKSLSKEEREKYEKMSQDTKDLANKSKMSGSSSKLKSDNKREHTPYYNFMTKRHEEIRKTNPEMPFKERSNQIIEEWTKMSLYEKAEYDDSYVPDSTQEGQTQEKVEGEEAAEDIEPDEMKLNIDDESDTQNNEQQNQTQQTEEAAESK